MVFMSRHNGFMGLGGNRPLGDTPGPSSYDQFVSALVANGGWFWDLTRADKLFQDSAGSTPVSALDHPIGRVVDVAQSTLLTQATSANRPLFKQGAGALFDGSNDGWASATTLDLTATDKAMVIVGLRKLNDAARGVIAELDAAAGSAGKFISTAPDFAAQASYGVVLQGSSTNTYYQMQSFAAPNTAVLSEVYDLAGASRVANVKGYVNGVANTDGAGGGNAGVGAVNFGNYNLYVGRRGGSSLPFNGYLTGLAVIPYIDEDLRLLGQNVMTSLNQGLPS